MSSKHEDSLEVKINSQNYLDEVKKKLSPNRSLPKISDEEIDYNIEMISIDEEDATRLFLAGIITNLELADILLGKTKL